MSWYTLSLSCHTLLVCWHTVLVSCHTVLVSFHTLLVSWHTSQWFDKLFGLTNSLRWQMIIFFFERKKEERDCNIDNQYIQFCLIDIKINIVLMTWNFLSNFFFISHFLWLNILFPCLSFSLLLDILFLGVTCSLWFLCVLHSIQYTWILFLVSLTSQIPLSWA